MIGSGFEAMDQGVVDYTVDVIPVNGVAGTIMGLPTEEGCVYITKEQAKDFFGLTEASPQQINRGSEDGIRIGSKQSE